MVITCDILNLSLVASPLVINSIYHSWLPSPHVIFSIIKFQPLFNPPLNQIGPHHTVSKPLFINVHNICCCIIFQLLELLYVSIGRPTNIDSRSFPLMRQPPIHNVLHLRSKHRSVYQNYEEKNCQYFIQKWWNVKSYSYCYV